MLKICTLCCIAHIGINASISNAVAHDVIHINDINLVNYRISGHSYIYTNITVNNNAFKNNATAVLYNNDTVLYITKDFVDIRTRIKYMSFDSDDVKTAFGNLQLEKFNALKKSLDKDFITYLEEDIKELFGNNYKIYFYHRNMEYNGQQIDENGYKDYFNGTFEELMKVNKCQQITTIYYNLQFMKNMWYYNNFKTKHLIITDNNVIYYYDINNNTISIYSKSGHQESVSKQNVELSYTKFIEKVKERWNNEQTAIRNIFGNDYRLYYMHLEYVNDLNEDIEDDNVI